MASRSTQQDVSHDQPSTSRAHRPRPPSRTPSFLAGLALSPLNPLSQSSQAFPKLKQSYENLVALANAREALRQTRREAIRHGKQVRKMVWRDRGEPPVELRSFEDCIEHAVRGGSRAGGLAFAIRSGVNFFLLLFRITRTSRKARTALVLHALFGPDSFRFAAMLGTFVAIYKFLINALPLASPPADFSPSLLPRTRSEVGSLSRETVDDGRTLWADEDVITPPEWIAHDLTNNSGKGKGIMGGDNGTITMAPKVKTKLSAQAVAHEIWVRKRGRRWHAFLAGTLGGGIAIMFEKQGRRVGIAQQMFVRGLQGTYNALSDRHGFTVPYGSVLVFSLCCGQIMYAWTMRPDTIPMSYAAWITQASKVGRGAIRINRQLVREGVADRVVKGEIVKFMHDMTTTEWNAARLKDELSFIESSSGRELIYPFASCALIHPWVDGCWMAQLDKFWAVFKWMFPVYGALHFVPSLLFKHQAWLSKPQAMAMRTITGTARSSSFISAFVMIYLAILCTRRNIYDLLRDSSRFPILRRLPLVPSLRNRTLGRLLFWIAGFCSGLSLFVEAERRHGELAMYVMPKALESIWVAARGKANPNMRKRMMGEAAFIAVAMGMVMSTYQNDPQHLSGLVRRILYQFVGPN